VSSLQNFGGQRQKKECMLKRCARSKIRKKSIPYNRDTIPTLLENGRKLSMKLQKSSVSSWRRHLKVFLIREFILDIIQ